MNKTQSEYPKWQKVLLIISSAVLAYRISTFLLSVFFVYLRATPFPVVYFFYRWDFAIVPLVAISVAVLFSRGMERVVANRQSKTRYIILASVIILAANPVQPRMTIEPSMCSPLYIAISDNYPIETLEMLIDRYPDLINKRDPYNPLNHAAYAYKTNMVQLLVRKGADVDYTVRDLMSMEAKEQVALVLKCSKDHNHTSKVIQQSADGPSKTSM